MTDVIDSLKRLERIGSETSKATEKLIEAAKQLETAIVSAFDVKRDQRGENVPSRKRYSLGATSEPDFPKGRDYEVTSNAVLMHLNDKWLPISKNRDTALAFSADVANGVLEVFADELEEIHTRARSASETLAKAAPAFTPSVLASEANVVKLVDDQRRRREQIDPPKR